MEHADLTPGSNHALVKLAIKPRVTVVRSEPSAESIVYELFKPWAIHYRATCSDLYKLVDEQLARPDRTFQSPQYFAEWAGPTVECPRCGYDFPVFGDRTNRFCSPECREEHKAFCRKRGIRFLRRA